jgi:hypothetical protein
MTQRLRTQLAALQPQPAPRPRPSARELLHWLLETADIESIDRDGNARMTLDVPPHLLDELAEWDDSEREDEEIAE